MEVSVLWLDVTEARFHVLTRPCALVGMSMKLYLIVVLRLPVLAALAGLVAALWVLWESEVLIRIWAA